MAKNKREKTYVPKEFRAPFGSSFVRVFLKIFVFIPFHMIYWTRVKNLKELKKHRGKPVILAVNHRSFTDVAAVFITFPRLRLFFIGRESLFKPHTLLNWILRCLGGFPLLAGNDLAVIRYSLNILKDGHSLVIFPEGTRSFAREDALAVRSGTAVIAMKSGVPVVPVVTNRPERPFRRNAFRIGHTLMPENYADRKDFSAGLHDEMARILDGFEIAPKQKKWDKEPVYNARVIAFKDNKLIAIKRSRDGQNFYTFPGGHVEKDENPRDAAVRELKEETNIDSEVIRTLYKKKYDGRMQGFYLCGYIGCEVSKTNADEYNDEVVEKHNTGTYEPVLIDTKDLANTDIRPNEIRDQLVKDIKKHGIRLTRPTKYIKSK